MQNVNPPPHLQQCIRDYKIKIKTPYTHNVLPNKSKVHKLTKRRMQKKMNTLHKIQWMILFHKNGR